MYNGTGSLFIYERIMRMSNNQNNIAWKLMAIALAVVLVLLVSSCVQHILKYDYYLKDPNSLHVESLIYKQNVFAMKTDKQMTKAAFGDILEVTMDRSIQVPDPNTVDSMFEGGGKLMKEIAPLLISDPLYLKGFENPSFDRGGV